jgi:electron transfer flavoprotein alpha/beta subunit
MKVLVAIKRVVDSNVRIRVRPDKVRHGGGDGERQNAKEREPNDADDNAPHARWRVRSR